jgi:hypothetical protein
LKKFGEYGELVRVLEYKEFEMIFDWLPRHVLAERGHCSIVRPLGGCGGLRLFKTNHLDVQKKLKGKPLGDGGGSDLEVGSFIAWCWPGTLWARQCTGPEWRRCLLARRRIYSG